MKTDEFAELLARGGASLPGRTDGYRRAALLLLGFLGSLVVTRAALGWNPALAQNLALPMFWIKEGFCLSLAAAGVVAALRLGRPGRSAGRAPAGIVGALGAMALLGAWVLYLAAPGERRDLIMGQTALVCPLLIALVCVPAFLAIFAVLRGLAPTRLGAAGAAAGFAAGSLGALAYSFHCPELGAPFLAVWYALGILLPTAAGAWLGPRVLRW